MFFLVTDTECVVLERTLSDRDWPDPELLTLHTHGSEPGAGGHEVNPNVTQSLSGEHQEPVTVTRQQDELLMIDSRPMVYLHRLNQSNQEEYANGPCDFKVSPSSRNRGLDLDLEN